jgi:hypothetical protein
MSSDFLENIDLSVWGLWIAIVIGLVAGGATLFTGRLVLRWVGGSAAVPAIPTRDNSFQVIPQSVEMRSANRRGGNAVAVFVADPQKTEEPQRGWVVDRSAGGLCIAVENPVDAGANLRVRVCNAPVTVPWAELEVKSCRKDGNHWEVGCQFVITPSYNVLMLFG